MIHTPVCDLLGIRHPIALGGMASHTSVTLVAAVSNAGGLGTLGMALWSISVSTGPGCTELQRILSLACWLAVTFVKIRTAPLLAA